MDSPIFAQRFPFTEKARQKLKEFDISLDALPEKARTKAANIILKANSKRNSEFETSPYEEDQKFELMAFPISKMIISVMGTNNIIEKFSDFFRERTFSFIVDDRESIFEIADELKVKYDLGETYFAEVSLLEYLDIYFVDEETKLVNKRVENGRVFLSQNDFARFLSEKVYKKIFDSLPIDKDSVPKEIIKLARTIDSQLVQVSHKYFDEKLSGKIDPNLFPPSIKLMYENQLAGNKLTYYERLTLGGFLREVGMGKEEMLIVFSKSPDYKKHIADYHINNIFSKELSAPGFKKMNEYGIKVFEEEKKYKHPVAYYKAKIRYRNKKKNLEKEKGGKNV